MFQTIHFDINKQSNGFLFDISGNKLELKTEISSFFNSKTMLINSSFLKDKSIKYLPSKKIKIEQFKKNKIGNLLNISKIYKSKSCDEPIYHEFYHYKNEKDIIYGLSISKFTNLKNKLGISHKALFFGKVRGKTVFFMKDINKKESLSILSYIENMIQKDFNSIIYKFNHIDFIERTIFSDYIFNIAELNEVKNIIYNDFHFLKNKKEKNIFKLFWIDICLPIYPLLFKDYYLFDEYIKKYSYYSKEHFLKDLKIKCSKNTNIIDLMSETNQLKQFKKIVPKANKQTIDLFNKELNKDKLNVDGVFYISFLNLFTSPEKMNEALKLINVQNYIFYSFEDKLLNKDDLNLIKEKFNGDNSFDKALIHYYLYVGDCLTNNHTTKYILEGLINIKNMLVRNDELYKSVHNEKSRNEIIDFKKERYTEFLNTKYFSISQLLSDLYELNSILEDGSKLIFYKSNNFEMIEDDAFILKEILNSGELKLIGQKLSNCLFSYKEDIKRGDYSIFYIENRITKNIEACIEYDMYEVSITQVKKKYNNLIKDENIINMIENWAKMNNISIITDDLKDISQKEKG